MTATLHKPARFELPTRVCAERKAARRIDATMALVDRIADLPGIETVERRDDSVPCQVDVYLKRDPERQLRSHPATLFCSLTADSVVVRGLDLWAQHKVISSGWGKLDFDRVRIYPPRNRRELEVVWKILQRAHDKLFKPSANIPGAHIVSTWDLPKFSRTTLQ